MHQGDAWMDLAQIFNAEGEMEAARRAAERAVKLYTRKMDNSDRDRARRFLAELPSKTG
jgi:Tfp pilus assembly protein PilF